MKKFTSTFIRIKKYFTVFIYTALFLNTTTYAQTFNKIVEADCSKTEEKNIRIIPSDYGIFFETKDDKKKINVKFISIKGEIFSDLNPSEAYSSDSSRLCAASVSNNKIEIRIYGRYNFKNYQAIISTKTIDEIFEEYGKILPKDKNGKYIYTPQIKSIFLLGKTVFLILRSQRDISFIDSYFFIDLDSPNEITKINMQFPKLNDEDPPNKRAWIFIDYNRKSDLLIFSREYILKDGVDKGQHSFAIATFNRKFDFVRLFDFCKTPDNDLSLQYLTNELIYNRNLNSLLVCSYVKSEKKINKSNYAFHLRSYNFNGIEDWKIFEWDPIYENYFTIKDQEDYFIDYTNYTLLYKYNYALFRHRYIYNLYDGNLILKNETSQFLVETNKMKKNLMQLEIENIMNEKKFKSYEIFSCENKLIILFKDGKQKYYFYQN